VDGGVEGQGEYADQKHEGQKQKDRLFHARTPVIRAMAR
jgi:hypothetical protein